MVTHTPGRIIDNRGRKRDWKRARIYLATAFYPCYQCVVTKFSEVLVLLVIGLTAKESVWQVQVLNSVLIQSVS